MRGRGRDRRPHRLVRDVDAARRAACRWLARGLPPGGRRLFGLPGRRAFVRRPFSGRLFAGRLLFGLRLADGLRRFHRRSGPLSFRGLRPGRLCRGSLWFGWLCRAVLW